VLNRCLGYWNKTPHERIAMDANEVSSIAAPTPQPAAAARLSPSQRILAAVLLAIGLLSAGGAAVVSAATPAPSSGSSGSSGGTTQTQNANCPNM
jgi:hypothetical protein